MDIILDYSSMEKFGDWIYVHPYAKLMPALSDTEFTNLVDSMITTGQMVPVLALAGTPADNLVVIDGYHRVKAHTTATEAGYELDALKVEYIKCETDRDILNAAIGANTKRRQMTVGQKAIVGARTVTTEGKGRPGENMHGRIFISAVEAAETVGVGQRSINQAYALLERPHSDEPGFEPLYSDLVYQVETGALDLNTADTERIARRRKVAADTALEAQIVATKRAMESLERYKEEREQAEQDAAEYALSEYECLLEDAKEKQKQAEDALNEARDSERDAIAENNLLKAKLAEAEEASAKNIAKNTGAPVEEVQEERGTVEISHYERKRLIAVERLQSVEAEVSKIASYFSGSFEDAVSIPVSKSDEPLTAELLQIRFDATIEETVNHLYLLHKTLEKVSF